MRAHDVQPFIQADLRQLRWLVRLIQTLERSVLQPALAAERTWFAVAPDGTEHDLAVAIGVPVQGEHGEWLSSVTMGVADPRTRAIAGIDSWQAICLAMSFAATRLSHFADQGWTFYWERGGDLATPEDLASVP